VSDEQITNAECVDLGKHFAETHGDDAWNALCDSWGMDRNYSQRVKAIFIAGLAMGFVEALKSVRDGIEEVKGGAT